MWELCIYPAGLLWGKVVAVFPVIYLLCLFPRVRFFRHNWLLRHGLLHLAGLIGLVLKTFVIRSGFEEDSFPLDGQDCRMGYR